ncbi:unnamed protein product, partial [Didymodactylos carnosus]
MLQLWTFWPSSARLSTGFSLTGTCDGGHSSIQNPSITSHKSSSPIYIKVQVNQTPQHAIIDTGSAVSIIHQQLLKKIHHKKFIYKRKIHASASCTSVNIIGEIHLEIKIQGHKTWIVADVATNLVTDLLLGTDWIKQNSVIIDSPQQRVILVNKYHKVIAYTPFVEPPDIRFPVFLIDQITLPPYSEQCIDVKVPSLFGNVSNVMFESTPHLYSKSIFAANALIKAEHHKTRIIVINASDRQRTLSKHTRLGAISYQPESNVCLTIPMTSNKRNVRLSDRSCVQSSLTHGTNDHNSMSRSWDLPLSADSKIRSADSSCTVQPVDCRKHRCYVCQAKFLSSNDLQKHLRQQLQQSLWRHGQLFDLRQPSIIKTTVRHAIETGNHPPVYTPAYRVSYKDEQIQRDEINKLLKQGIIEESTSPWSSPIVLVRKKDGSMRFCIDFRKLNSITTKDAFPIPRIDDIFDHLAQAEYYTTIDFKSGYFQAGLDPRDRPKTAFSTRDQHLQFTVLPRGVTNGPPAFQRIVSQILGPTRWQYSLAYLDDVIIYSQTFEQHLVHLNDILNRLNQAYFRLNVDKCHIAKTTINFLGHCVEH